MATSRLTSDERQVLGALIMPPGTPIAEKTVPKIARTTGLDEGQVDRTLSKLADMEPPLVHQETDATLNVEFWIPLESAIEALEGVE